MKRKRKSTDKHFDRENIESVGNQPAEFTSSFANSVDQQNKSESYSSGNISNEKAAVTKSSRMDRPFLESSDSSKTETQSKTTMLFASFFLGAIGLHRLLMGYKNWWIMPLTLGGFGIWSLIDFARIALGKMLMANGVPLDK